MSVGETSGLNFPVGRVPVPRDCWIARARTMARDRPSPYGEGAFFHRSAGACPPRSLCRNEKRPQPQRHGRLLSRSIHGEGQALALRGEKGVLGAVARGPVPRDLSAETKNVCNPEAWTFAVTIAAWRGTGPRPTVGKRCFRCRSAGACPPRSFSCLKQDLQD